MFGQAEDCGSVGLRVTTNPLEDRRAIVDNVGHYMDIGLVPGDEFSVVPDIGRGLDRH